MLLEKEPVTGQFGIGHTRWATHGRPTEENAHPHRDCKGRIVVVHNGIIENYVALKRSLIAEGHRFTTETDTEVIAHLLEKNFKGNLEEAVLATLEGSQGSLRLCGSLRRRSRKAGCGEGRRSADCRKHAKTRDSWRRIFRRCCPTRNPSSFLMSTKSRWFRASGIKAVRR